MVFTQNKSSNYDKVNVDAQTVNDKDNERAFYSLVPSTNKGCAETEKGGVMVSSRELNWIYRVLTAGRPTRRQFIGVACNSLLLAGCSKFSVDDSNINTNGFNLSSFARKYGTQNHFNPYLKGGISTYHTFQEAFSNRSAPGIGYSVIVGRAMVAVADGEVAFIQNLTQKYRKDGGLMVTVSHPNQNNQEYKSQYAYLNDVPINIGDEVKRGDLIGRPTTAFHAERVKLIFEDGTWVDPDDYGVGHGYMRFKNDHSGGYPDEKLMSSRWRKQKSIITELYSTIGIESIPDIYHKKSGYGTCTWSNVKHFKALEGYFNDMFKKGDAYLSLTIERFYRLRSEFYANQPIVLTLPFK